MFDSVCTALVARIGMAATLAAYGRSCRSLRQSLDCGRRDVNARRDLLFSMGESVKERKS